MNVGIGTEESKHVNYKDEIVTEIYCTTHLVPCLQYREPTAVDILEYC